MYSIFFIDTLIAMVVYSVQSIIFGHNKDSYNLQLKLFINYISTQRLYVCVNVYQGLKINNTFCYLP